MFASLALLALTVAGCAKERPNEPTLPLEVIRGGGPGPTLALVAGVHGGKVAAVEALDALAAQLRPADLAGTLLIVRPANLAGFRAGLAQTSPGDGLNLNRVFPGRTDGSPTERLAARIMEEIVAESDYLVDLHGSDGDEAVGTFAYVARPGIEPRVDSLARELARGWGVPLIIWDEEGPRSVAESRFLQTAAHLSGVPAMTVFHAGRTRRDSAATAAFVDGATRLLRHLGMLVPPDGRTPTEPTIPRSLPRRVVETAAVPGSWVPRLAAGRDVPRGELLGLLRDSLGVPDSIIAPVPSVVLHQRLAGGVVPGTPLVILAPLADSLYR